MLPSETLLTRTQTRQPQSFTLQCDYFERGICASCTLIEQPYERQLADKQARAAELLAPYCAADAQWLEPFASLPENFRNKVKLVVTGTIERPNLGILTDPATGTGADLQGCPLPTLGIRSALPALARFITTAQLQPYNMATDKGVLKYVIVMESPAGELMVRFVVRRRGAQGAIFRHFPELEAALPQLRVCSINVQPEHKAIIEGAEEIFVTEATVLPMSLTLADFSDGEAPSDGAPASTLDLQVRAQSFFQTNTDAAAVLYRRAQEWLAPRLAASAEGAEIWDLYCGVGGFALALAGRAKNENRHLVPTSQVPAVQIVGIETTEAAVTAANHAAQASGVANFTRFETGDALSWARERDRTPIAVIVNPPRRGIGTELAGWLGKSGTPTILYSSCNATTLARDLAAMPEYRIVRAQVVDMFPHTRHFETIVLLEHR